MPEAPFARYDSADYLKTEEGGDDPAYVARALGVVARVKSA